MDVGHLVRICLIALEASIRTNITCIVLNAVTKRLIRLSITTPILMWIHRFVRGAEPRWTDSERRIIMEEVKNYPPYLDYPKPYKAKTNADRIREMSDEELRNWLFQRDCKNIAAFLQHGGAGVMDAAQLLDWLQQPAKEE